MNKMETKNPKTMIGITVCRGCGKLFEKRIPIIFDPSARYYCCLQCKYDDKELNAGAWTPERKERQSEKFVGSGNPNFGKNWSDEQKAAQSVRILENFANDPTLAYRCGAANRGVKFTPERVQAMHGHRSRESYIRCHDEETRKLIGEKSSAKWTLEFRVRRRKTMEDLGFWIPLDQTDPYKLYYKEANWIDSMVEFMTADERTALAEHGWFNQITNTKGYVRDHIVPRRSGWLFGLPPEVLRHPANMQFISHAENVVKGFIDRRMSEDDQLLVIADLVKRIKSFENPWKEQEKCLQLLQEGRF